VSLAFLSLAFANSTFRGCAAFVRLGAFVALPVTLATRAPGAAVSQQLDRLDARHEARPRSVRAPLLLAQLPAQEHRLAHTQRQRGVRLRPTRLHVDRLHRTAGTAGARPGGDREGDDSLPPRLLR
jgi:hypothetical protein